MVIPRLKIKNDQKNSFLFFYFDEKKDVDKN